MSILPTFAYFQNLISKPTKPPGPCIPSSHASLLPFQILHSALTLLLIFASHTQIALRVALTDPVVWWNIADMAFEWDPAFLRPLIESTLEKPQLSPIRQKLQAGNGVREQSRGWMRSKEEEVRSGRRMTKWGRIWVGYVVIWGAVSLLLWAGHYPPA